MEGKSEARLVAITAFAAIAVAGLLACAYWWHSTSKSHRGVYYEEPSIGKAEAVEMAIETLRRHGVKVSKYRVHGCGRDNERGEWWVHFIGSREILSDTYTVDVNWRLRTVTLGNHFSTLLTEPIPQEP